MLWFIRGYGWSERRFSTAPRDDTTAMESAT